MAQVAVASTARSKWIDEGVRALAAGGPDAVRIEPLAKALGVTKGGFYWHFEDRGALLAELLDEWERIAVDEVIRDVEAAGGDGRARLRRLFSAASADRAREILRTDLAVRGWARRDASVAKRLRRVDNRRMEYMRSLFRDFVPDDDEVEARCLLAFSLFTGSAFIAADHGKRGRAEARRLALEHLVA